MKINRLFLCAMAVAAIAAGCNDSEDDPVFQAINVTPTSLTFSQEGGSSSSQTVYVTSNRDWTVSCDATWVVVSPTSGSASDDAVSVTIYADANTSAERTATVTFATSSVTAQVTVTQSGDGSSPDNPDVSGEGTKDNPYTVAEALQIINAGTYTSDNVYTKGIVSSIDAIDTSYGNATYYISDDGTTDDELEVYRGYYLGGAAFTSEDQLQEGDEVIVYGKLILYNEIPEITASNYLYSINGETAGETNEEDENEKDLVYGNDFDKNVVTANTTLSDSVDDYKNETGSGIDNVSYAWSSKMSVRISSASSVYTDASGNNNIFFGTDNPGYFVIKNITLPSGETNYKLKYGATMGSTYDHDNFKVYISEDNASWVELSYEFEGGDPAAWGLAYTTFTVPSGTESLYIYYRATATSVYRIDDVQLLTYAVEGTSIDFSTGVELEGGDKIDNGGGSDEVTTTGDGTLDNPYTIADCYAILTAGTQSSSEVYLKGIVSQIGDLNSSYGELTYYLSDDGTTTSDELMIYQGYGLNGEKITSTDYLTVGDEIVVSAQIKIYSGIYETNYGSTIYSINGETGDEGSSTETEGSGTVDDPYTIADCLAILADGNESTSKVYLTGTVSQIGDLNSSYGELTYYLSDDGTTSNELMIYQGYGLNGEKIYSADYLTVGDVVVVNAQIKTYNGISETNYGSTIISINGETEKGDDGSGEEVDLSDPWATNVSWTSETQTYVQEATINDSGTYTILKLGSSSATGSSSCTIPSGSTGISFYCIAWKNVGPAPFTVTVGDTEYSGDDYKAEANEGLSGNAPYTLTMDENSDHWDITFDSALTADTTVKVETTDSSYPRAAFIGFRYLSE